MAGRNRPATFGYHERTIGPEDVPMNDAGSADDAPNPLGMDGIEFVEYLSRHPDALGAALTRLGFQRIARHRSRAVTLYRQGPMNLIINADPVSLSSMPEAEDNQIRAIALRVADANRAYEHCMQWGAWPIPTRAGAMELNIPGIHGVGDSILYLVDQRRSFSIYDIDFDYVSERREVPCVVPGLHIFGVVQYINPERSAEWVDFYAQLLGFRALPPSTHFGILPHGTILESPCGKLWLQLVEPVGDAMFDTEWYEQFARLAFGAPDVISAVQILQTRGVPFQDNAFIRPDAHGAITAALQHDVTFEFVHHRAADDADGAGA